MAANKNQHFVPKCHLKPFSLYCESAAINVFNHSSDKGIPDAPVKGQCSKSYFYGRDLKLEKAFQKIEGPYADIIKKIMSKEDSLTEADLYTLREFAFLQMNRTEANLKRRAMAYLSLDKLAHLGFEKHRKDISDLSHEEMLRNVMKTYIDTRHTIQDLATVIIENQTSKDFITSDDPAITINRLYMQRLGGRAFGMASSGTQLVMPLTPRFCLMCYDKDAYRSMNKRGHRIFVKKRADVNALNELQFIRSQANIYFQNWNEFHDIRKAFEISKHRRPEAWVKFWVWQSSYEKSGFRYYRKLDHTEIVAAKNRIISFSAEHLNPSRWLSVLPIRPKVCGYTNGSAVGYIRRGQLGLFESENFWSEKIPFSSKSFEPNEVALSS